MKNLYLSNLDNEENELYEMLSSKFNEKELLKVAKLLIIDAEKWKKESNLNISIQWNEIFGTKTGKYTVFNCTDVIKTINEFIQENPDSKIDKINIVS